jgi:hypothetical protein
MHAAAGFHIPLDNEHKLGAKRLRRVVKALAFVFALLFRLDRVNSDKLIGNAVHDSVMDRLPLVSLVSRMLGNSSSSGGL